MEWEIVQRVLALIVKKSHLKKGINMTPNYNYSSNDNHLDKFREMYEQSQRKSKPSKVEPEKSALIGFPTKGNHIVQFFSGPDGRVLRKVIVHHNGRSNVTHCPDFYKDKKSNQDYPKCEICLISEQKKIWRYKVKFLHMIYGLLIETDNPKDYWRPGEIYIVLMDKKLHDAFNRMAKPFLDKDIDLWNAFLDPNVSSFGTHISSQEIAQGSFLDMKPMFESTLPPIELGDWYKPLSECWLPEEFNMSDYKQVLEAVKNSRS